MYISIRWVSIFSLFFLCQFLNAEKKSDLDYVIPAEIKNDALYYAIYNIAKAEKIKTILEIGSSSGEGSTEAFVSGINENPNNPSLYCLEISKERFAVLKNHYQDNPRVNCYYASSIPLESFPSEDDVILFYTSINTALNNTPLGRVLSWLRQDIAYIKKHNVPQHGISLIKKENGIDYFDVVLIDGSEFTGAAELKHVYGAKFILLDDTNTYKNYANYNLLKKDPNYELLEHNNNLRNGYAVFKRTT